MTTFAFIFHPVFLGFSSSFIKSCLNFSGLQASQVSSPLLHCLHLLLLRDPRRGRRPRLHLPHPGGAHHPGGDDRRHPQLRPRGPGVARDPGLGPHPGNTISGIIILYPVPHPDPAPVLRPHDGEGDGLLADVEVQQDPQPGGSGHSGGAGLLLRH